MPTVGTRKRELLKAIAVGGATAIAGCFGGGDDDPLEDGVDEDGDDGADNGSDQSGLVSHEQFGPDDGEPLLFWAQPGSTPDPDQQPTNEVYADAFRPAYKEWAENNPDYRIDVEYQTNLEQMQTQLLQTSARGDPPDISEVDSFWIPNHWNNLQPVTDVIEDPDDWFPFVQDIVQPEDEWLAVWRNTDARALYYRKPLIEEYADGEPPRTWDEVVEVGTEIVENEDMEGYMYNGGRWEATTFDNLAHFWAQGGELVDDEGAPILGEGDNYDALVNVFEWFQQTIESGITPERVANVDDYAILSQEALDDNVAMFLGGSWQIHAEIIPELGEDEAEELWGVAEIPQPEEDMTATGTGGWTYGVFTEDEDLQEPAKDFAGLWADNENMGHYCETLGQLPTKQSVFEEREFFSEDPYMQTYQDMLEDGVARPGFPIYRTISSEWQIAAGRVITGDETPEGAVDIMVENIETEYES